MGRSTAILVTILVAVFAVVLVRAANPVAVSDPRSIRIVVSDIPHFWAAFDAASRGASVDQSYGKMYFARGSAGLRGFVPNRLVSPQHLAKVVAANHVYYAATRKYMMRVLAETGAIRADLERFKAIYPPAVFENIYFVVGALNSGGTSVEGVGVVLGAEMLSKPPGYRGPVSIPSSVLRTAGTAPLLVTHEFIHFNQHDADTRTLLGGTLVEGTAQYVSEAVDRHVGDPAQWRFGCAHELQLWDAFSAQMQRADEKTMEAWLFNFNGSPGGGPPFMGYWIGQRIAQTYFERSTDKTKALHDIFNVTDYRAFLRKSGYPRARPACVPAKL